MIDMDMLGLMRDMPLLSNLHFQESALPAAPEDIVGFLLQQARAAP